VDPRAGLDDLEKRKFLKNYVFWDVAPCRSCVNRRFLSFLEEEEEEEEERKKEK
jgi:hypothetical protein